MDRFLILPRWRQSAVGNILPCGVAGVALLGGLALAGCHKKEECEGTCIESHGRIGSELNSTVTLSGVDLQLSSIGNGRSFFSEPEILIKQVRSGPDGTYSIRFVPTSRMQERGRYRLLYGKPGYGDEVNGGYAEQLRLEPGKSQEQNLHLPRLGGRLLIQITGFPGGSAANSTYMNVYSGRGRKGYAGIGVGSSFYDTATGSRANSSSNLTDVSCQTAANQYAFITIYKTKAGVNTSLQDSVFCPLNQVVTYAHAF
jgi:hypothetical protein